MILSNLFSSKKKKLHETLIVALSPRDRPFVAYLLWLCSSIAYIPGFGDELNEWMIRECLMKSHKRRVQTVIDEAPDKSLRFSGQQKKKLIKPLQRDFEIWRCRCSVSKSYVVVETFIQLISSPRSKLTHRRLYQSNHSHAQEEEWPTQEGGEDEVATEGDQEAWKRYRSMSR